MSGRFPGSPDCSALWRRLSEGVESVSSFTREELEAAGVSPELLDRPDYVPASAVLEDIDLFDAAFFDFNPREAATTDPQHRIFLECAWEALENAAYAPRSFAGPIAVFASAGTGGYAESQSRAAGCTASPGDLDVRLGNDKDHLATRVAYKLNLRGPAISVQTACSSSLTAIHLARQSLLAGECDIALGNTYYMGLMQTNEQEPEQKEWANAIKILFPDADGNGTHVNISGAVLLKHAPHKDEAVRLIEFLTSDEAQKLYAEVNFEYPLKVGVAPSEIVASWGALKADPLPLSDVAANRAKASALVDEVNFDAGPAS